MKNIIIFILIIFSSISFAQKITIGEIKKLYSKNLGEEREIWVNLPNHYADSNFIDQAYPVIYLLDGEKYFHETSGIIKNLSQGFYPQMPEAILIGIINRNRSKDLTPTIDSNQKYVSGGAKKFSKFIREELIPEINQKYRTTKLNILIGHSFGGLFAVDLFLKYPNSFTSFISIEPSLWWDNKILLSKVKSPLKLKSKVLLTVAGANINTDNKNSNEQYGSHYKAINEFNEIMNSYEENNLTFSHKDYLNEDHGSVFMPSLINSLREIFSEFKINVKELMKYPSIMEQTYQKLTEKLGVSLYPQSFYIDSVVELAKARGASENAKYLHNLNLDLYPNNKYLRKK